ncbi:MAG: hypothetical protein ISS57_11105 [Anaerolineales bacterium]|nr:hypothetical protein [Anaerolineales bacterium]
MKPNHFLWLIPLVALSLWLLLPVHALADFATQTADGPTAPTPTPIPLYPDDVVVPKTHFPGLIAGAIVIVVVIMVGVLVRPRK